MKGFLLFVGLLLASLSVRAQSKTLSLVRQTGDNLAYTNTYSVTGWTNGTFYTVVPGGTLAVGGVYLVQLSYAQSGLDNIEQAYVLPIVLTYTGASAVGITGNAITYSGVSRNFQLRYRPNATTSNIAVGLEVTPSENGFNSTLTVTCYRLN